MTKTIGPVLHIKVDQETKNAFEEKCKEKYNIKHTDMLRELMKAFVEGRVTITPDYNQKTLMTEVYNES